LLWIKLELSPLETEKRTVFYPKRNLEEDFIKSAVLSSLIDTPEGKSIVELAGIEVTTIH
jgi:high-affinity K+ transport system ATPase subunit B